MGGWVEKNGIRFAVANAGESVAKIDVGSIADQVKRIWFGSREGCKCGVDISGSRRLNGLSSPLRLPAPGSCRP
jgi:hypothetical protein